MEKKVNSCKLCKNSSDLRDSHFIPKGLYRIVCAEEKENPNPIIISPNSAWTTSKQAKSFLLCGKCEERLNRNGEDYVLENCYRSSSEFKLRTVLEKQEPTYNMDSGCAYSCSQVRELDISKIIYFAASVFWRASVHQWILDQQVIKASSLGAKYEEEFRRFLMEESSFPKNARMCVMVSRITRPDNVVIFPFASREEGFYFHRFSIPGILFFMYLGKVLPPIVREIGLPIGDLIFLVDSVERVTRWESLKLAETCKPRGKLKK